MAGYAVLNPPALERRREWGPLILRVFTGAVLVYGTLDNVLSHERMVEFEAFVAQNGFPWPAFSARFSAYAQFLCGILIALGLLTRPAALAMVINFAIALAMVHVGLPFSANIAPLSMLFLNAHLVFYGGGILSLDGRLQQPDS